MKSKTIICNKTKKIIAGIIVFAMTLQVCYFSPNVVDATLTKKPTPTQVSEIKTYANNEQKPNEYYTIRTPLDEKNVIYIEGKVEEGVKRLCVRIKKHKSTSYVITAFITPNESGEFSIKIDTTKGNTDLPEVIAGKEADDQIKSSYSTQPGYKAIGTISAGTYHLRITKAFTDEDADVSSSTGSNWFDGALGGTLGEAAKGIIFTVQSNQSNNLKLVKYTAAITNNRNVRKRLEPNSNTISYEGSFVRYTDKYLKDMSFVLINPKTGKRATMTSSKVSYIKNLTDRITADASTDYDKLLKIYEYLIDKFYYDQYAFSKKKNQFVDPYRNLYNLENKINSENSKSGKVATVCHGYASMLIAMARTLNIPARLANGCRITQPGTVWADKKNSDMSKTTHWWAEVYLNGRWMVIDPTSGSSNIWSRTSFSSAGKWENNGIRNYTYFDVSDDFISSGYSYNEIYQGATDGKYLTWASEVKQLKTFLNTKSNGKKLNSKYSSGNFSTWGTGVKGNFVTNGYGRTNQISWPKKKLSGALNLSNFSALKYLSISTNNLTSINLKGCSSLLSIYAGFNNVTTFDSTASSKVTVINMKGTKKLRSAKFKHGSKKITITTNVKKGNFGFEYKKSASKKVKIYANNKVRGYKYLGIYTSSGKKLSSKATYSFYPSKSKYIVKYKKK